MTQARSPNRPFATGVGRRVDDRLACRFSATRLRSAKGSPSRWRGVGGRRLCWSAGLLPKAGSCVQVAHLAYVAGSFSLGGG
jgi:hypothetical protein